MKMFIFLNAFLIFFLLICNHSSASVPFAMRYGYGIKDLARNEDVQLHPSQWYQTNNAYVQFKLSEDLNLEKQSLHKLFVYLSIKQKKSNLVSVLSFENKSSNSYFIRNTSLPYVPINSERRLPVDSTSTLCRMFFFISTDNIALDYLGGKCDYRSSFDKTDWYELFPNSKVFFTIILNNQYEFLPVNKLYRIRTSEFNFVKKEWFTEKNINDAMFFLLGNSEKTKSISEYGPFLSPISNKYILEDHEIECFMRRFGFEGEKENYFINIYSNQVYMVVNGKKIKSFYK